MVWKNFLSTGHTTATANNDMTILYAARMDVTPSFIKTFEDWYDNRHAPDLIRSGFYSCSAYYALTGSPTIHNIYLIPSVDIFTSEKYLTARNPEVDKLRSTVLDNVSNRSNTPYEQIAVMNAESSDVPNSKMALGLQFNSEESIDSVKQLFSNVFAGCTNSVRLCRRSGSHINVSQEPDWYLFGQMSESNNDFSSMFSEMAAHYEMELSQQILNLRVSFNA